MGYSYDKNNRLCCDICGKSGNVRKYPCPFGYCQATAACPECRKKHASKFGKKAHRKDGCEKRHREWVQLDNERIEMLAQGKAVRCSALGLKDGSRVHVLFQRVGGECEGYYMAKETYDAFPLLVNVTPEDYRKHGELTPAPSDFDYSE